MRVLVISGRSARQPWMAGGMSARVCAALVRAGHSVTLAAQSVDDPAAFAMCERIEAFDSFDQTATDWPAGFAGWARRQRRIVPHEVCLSLSRVAAGDVWMPLEPSGAAWLGRARRTLGIKSLAIAAARHHGAFAAWASDAFFVTPRAGEMEPIRRMIAVGRAAGEASRILHRARGLGERVVRAEAFAMVEPPGAEEMAQLRRQTRALLGIGAERRVVLVSVPLPVGGTIDAQLGAVAELGARNVEHGPLLLMLAKDCVALHTRAVKCGAAAQVRIQGLTGRMDAALAAADVVALPHKSALNVFETGGMGRLGADGLRFGRPLLAVSGAPGYELARLRSRSEDEPGMVLDVATREAWTRALRQVGEDQWLTRASSAASEVGAPMTFERFMGTVERVLGEAGAERGEERLKR